MVFGFKDSDLANGDCCNTNIETPCVLYVVNVCRHTIKRKGTHFVACIGISMTIAFVQAAYIMKMDTKGA